jgi:6-pyruvoyltetrahydropterin/6-carboxytetrahydropterin synthase
MIGITVQHNFETAHRLPFLGGKCQNWHGHSWLVEFMITNLAFEEGINHEGITAEFGLVKSTVRGYIDSTLDHGVMIGVKDPMLDAFDKDPYMAKLFVFGEGGNYEKLPWPTVEAVADMLGNTMNTQLQQIAAEYRVLSCRVRETLTNTAVWTCDATSE